jgi:hypothetical protein
MERACIVTQHVEALLHTAEFVYRKGDASKGANGIFGAHHFQACGLSGSQPYLDEAILRSCARDYRRFANLNGELQARNAARSGGTRITLEINLDAAPIQSGGAVMRAYNSTGREVPSVYFAWHPLSFHRPSAHGLSETW